MADGSPRVTQTLVDTDGEHLIINTVEEFLKPGNIARDPRVAVAIADPANPFRYWEVPGRVLNTTTDGSAEHIELLARKYTGGRYAWFDGG